MSLSNGPRGCVRYIVWIAAALSFASSDASPTASVSSYEGFAYAAGSGRLLYRESHWVEGSAPAARRLVLYQCPDGAPFARKHIDATHGVIDPDFDFEDARTGYREGVRTRRNAREVYFRLDADHAEKSAPLRPIDGIVIDAGFDAFIDDKWDALVRGATVPLHFLVPSRLGSIEFHAGARPPPRSSGDVRRFRLTIGSWYGFALPHIDVAYDATSHTLLEYSGLSNVRNLDGRNLDVRIEFPQDRRHDDPSAADLERAEHVPLDGHCATD
jgi:hypothetical protein